MINYSKAKKLLKINKINLRTEILNVSETLNRVNSENIYSKVNYPVENNTAFDGYAINSNDTHLLNKKKPKLFKVLKRIAAGQNPKISKVKKFETVEVMTGALILKPFDTIIPVERINFHPNKNKKNFIYINKKIKKHNHIRFKGSDFKINDLIISKGEIINQSHILALKSLGIKKVKVVQKPKILFFSTGNEISEKRRLKKWQIPNSNRQYIKSLSKNFLFDFIDGGTLRDDHEKRFEKILKKKINSNINIIITSGAVSAGKFDFVPSVIKKFKLNGFFKGVAMRPGRPILFAKFKNSETCFFGIPGNSISSAACFRFFVYPYMENILNIKSEKPFKAILKKSFKKNKNFTRFLKANIISTRNGNLQVEILKGQESFKIKPLVKSNVWAVLKSGKSSYRRGELIDCFGLNFPNQNILK